MMAKQLLAYLEDEASIYTAKAQDIVEKYAEADSLVACGILPISFYDVKPY